MSILCCLVHLGRVLWLWQEGWEETERAFTACTWHVCDEAAASTPAEPPPCTSEPEWAESTDGHAHTQILYTSTDTGDISDMGYSIYRRHWLDRMHLIIGFWPLGGGSVQEFRAVLGGRGTVKLFIAVRMFVHRLREFVLPQSYLRVARFDFYLCSHKIYSSLWWVLESVSQWHVFLPHKLGSSLEAAFNVHMITFFLFCLFCSQRAAT